MATTLYNKATLKYTSEGRVQEVSSNIASVSLQGPLEISKNALEDSYHLNDSLTYTVILKNTSTSDLTNLIITDNLGSYVHTTAGTLIPLSYVGPGKLYVDNVFVGDVATDVSSTGGILFPIGSLGAGKSMMLLYRVQTNEFAAANAGASITNTVTAQANGLTEPVSASWTLPIAAYSSVNITKTMSPDPVVYGSNITYTFHIQNFGTTAASSVVLEDVFDPAPNILSVSVNGTLLTSTDYDYDKATGIFRYPAADTPSPQFTIPAATFTQDETTGEITVHPGTSTVIIEGSL